MESLPISSSTTGDGDLANIEENLKLNDDTPVASFNKDDESSTTSIPSDTNPPQRDPFFAFVP